MKPQQLIRWLFLAFAFAGFAPALGGAAAMPGDPLKGNGEVSRSILTYDQLFADAAPTAPVDDSAGFGLPVNAAQASENFEGTLTLSDPAAGGGFKVLENTEAYESTNNSPWMHLAPFSFQFVQSGSDLIPVEQGLVITGSPAWNYIVGPGRIWQESGDHGYMRASFPFALVERNQNCVHNGEMTFLFSNVKSPNVSKVRYQVTQETCLYLKFDLWGQLPASYTRGKVANAQAVRDAAIVESADRLPTKPFSALLTDYPKAGIDLASFTKPFRVPGNITTYGLFIHGINYVAGCQTRYGVYAFCENLRVPSYSLAKSSVAGVAMMWLGQQYGTDVYQQLIRNYVPEYVDGGDWENVTFSNASDMATGNYNHTEFEGDESSPQELAFLVAEKYIEKIADALRPFPHRAVPGTTFVYQTHTTFLLTQAMSAYLKGRQGSDADIFNAIRDHVYKPIHFSQGSLTTLRTDNSPSGKPFGGYGLFLIQDDIAKLGHFLNDEQGAVSGKQVLEHGRLTESLFRTANPAVIGVLVPDVGKPTVPNTFRYHNFFWGKHMTPTEFPRYKCDFWVPFMSGYGGNIVLLLPNGAVYYIFSDGNEFIWYAAVEEINKIAPLCQ